MICSAQSKSTTNTTITNTTILKQKIIKFKEKKKKTLKPKIFIFLLIFKSQKNFILFIFFFWSFKSDFIYVNDKNRNLN